MRQKQNINIRDEKDRHMLKAAVDLSRRQLQTFRENRVDFIRQDAGANYSENGAPLAVPVPLISVAKQIYMMNLVGGEPRVLATTPFPKLKPTAHAFEMAMNYLLAEIEFGETLRQAVQEALFSIGIIKTGLNSSQRIPTDSNDDPGQPFAKVVELEDFVFDMTRRSIQEVAYIGDYFRVPVDEAYDSGLYKHDMLDKMSLDEHHLYDEYGVEKSEAISQGLYQNQDEFENHFRFLYMWLPREGVCITIPAEGEPHLLYEREDDGPEGGPYDILRFDPLCGNIMPVSPMARIYDLHMIENEVFNKVTRQALRQKDILGYRGDASDDAERITSTSDGEAIRMDQPQNAKEFKYGGADANNLAFTIHVKQLFSWVGGGLDSLGGLGPMADTATADQLISQTASKKLAWMQKEVQRFTQSVCKKLAQHTWEDPFYDPPLSQRIMDRDYPIQFHTESRYGEYKDYIINVEPHSLKHMSPAQRLQQMGAFLSTVAFPLQEQMMAQGMMLDIEGLFRTWAKLSGMDELEDLVQFVETEEADASLDRQKSSRMSPNTTRTNVRVNKPGGTQQGQEEALMRSLLGGAGSVQPAELAGIGR